jgi:hypothetical protein
MGRADPSADWRNAAAYAPLLGADRSIFAWEWLRRDPGYRAAAAQVGGGNSAAPALWGLHAFELPHRTVPDARPVWRGDLHPHVLVATATKADKPPDAFDLSPLSRLVTLVREIEGGEHLLLSDGLRTLRIDIVEGRVAADPVELHYRLSGRNSAKGPLLALRRLLALCDKGSFSRTLHPREPSARRWILALRVHDALAAGAGQREIAAELLSDAASEARWRVHAASVRSQVQRLVRATSALGRGGYREFLR